MGLRQYSGARESNEVLVLLLPPASPLTDILKGRALNSALQVGII
jgi:hypothetical protein